MGVCASSLNGGATATARRGVSLALRGGVGGLSPTSPPQAVLPLPSTAGACPLHSATTTQEQVTSPIEVRACDPETPKKLPLPLLPVASRSMKLQANQQASAESTEGGSQPPIVRSTSAPMLPSRAVPSRMELFRQEEESRQNGIDGVEVNHVQSPLLPAPKSPTTACSAARRRKRRSVTFGEAVLVPFTVDASESHD